MVPRELFGLVGRQTSVQWGSHARKETEAVWADGRMGVSGQGRLSEDTTLN